MDNSWVQLQRAFHYSYLHFVGSSHCPLCTQQVQATFPTWPHWHHQSLTHTLIIKQCVLDVTRECNPKLTHDDQRQLTGVHTRRLFHFALISGTVGWRHGRDGERGVSHRWVWAGEAHAFGQRVLRVDIRGTATVGNQLEKHYTNVHHHWSCVSFTFKTFYFGASKHFYVSVSSISSHWLRAISGTKLCILRHFLLRQRGAFHESNIVI